MNKEPGEIQGQINQVRYRLDYLQRQIELTNFSALPYTSGEDMRGRYETFDVEYLNLRRENIQFAAKVRILTKIDYPTEKDVTVLEELEDVGEVLAGGVQSLGQKVEAAIFELPQVK